MLLADLEAEDGSYHAADSGFHGHHGFDRTALERSLTAAGLVPMSYRTVATARRTDHEGRERHYPVFLAVARRP